MKRRRILHLLVLILALSVLLSACADGEKAPDETSAALSSEQKTPDYPWLAGNGPIPDRRMGLARQGLWGIAGGFDCTDSGYYILSGVWSGSGSLSGTDSIVFYGDHGSDTLIMLCGRPDCSHDNEDCNAVFHAGQSIRYNDAHLYVTWTPEFFKPKVTRMDLDGSNQTVALDLAEQESDETGLQFTGTPILYGDVLSVSAKKLDASGDDVYMNFYRKLNDPADRLIRLPHDGGILQDGDTYLLTYDGSVDRWDPDTNETEHLANVDGSSFGYFGAEEAWSIKDGVVYRLTYASGMETPVLDTGLRPTEGERIKLTCFPDHLAVRYERLAADTGEVCVTYYFYNWAFEALGEVTFGGDDNYIIGETPERLIFCCASPRSPSVPRYYVDKADFGTGHIEIREFNMPDVDWTEIDVGA